MRKRLSYANVAATLAIALAMSGGALAAEHYLINSTRQINPKVLRALKDKVGPAGPAGPTGASGAQGKEGAQGNEGAQGPSDVWQAGDGSSGSSHPPLTVSVPAGSYLVAAKTVLATTGGEGNGVCTLRGGTGSENGYGAVTKIGIIQMTIPNVETTSLSSPGTIKLECNGPAETTFYYAKLTATRIGAIH